VAASRQERETTMKLLLDTQRVQPIANGKANNVRRNNGLDEIDFPPVVKLVLST
jgi:hypothetical protein